MACGCMGHPAKSKIYFSLSKFLIPHLYEIEALVHHAITIAN